MQDADHQILRDAIARNLGAVISFPTPAGDLRHHKTRFLADTGDGFWVESVRSERDLIDAVIAARQPCGVSFKSGPAKVVFGAPVDARQSDYRLSQSLAVEALLMPFPAAVKTITRRAAYRVTPGCNSDDFTVKVWRMSPVARLHDRPHPATAIPATLRDLSVNGVGVTLTSDSAVPPKICPADRLRVELTTADHTLLFEGRLAHPKTPITTPTVRAGIQFLPPSPDPTSRQSHQTLTRLIGDLQRAEVRRHRLGLTRTP